MRTFLIAGCSLIVVVMAASSFYYGVIAHNLRARLLRHASHVLEHRHGVVARQWPRRNQEPPMTDAVQPLTAAEMDALERRFRGGDCFTWDEWMGIFGAARASIEDLERNGQGLDDDIETVRYTIGHLKATGHDDQTYIYRDLARVLRNLETVRSRSGLGPSSGKSNG